MTYDFIICILFKLGIAESWFAHCQMNEYASSKPAFPLGCFLAIYLLCYFMKTCKYTCC